MSGQTEEKKRQGRVKNICVGLLAHVDAGKTTLSEAMLYAAGELRRPGRVDHGDTLLDNFALERQRGITIFSKQAELLWRDSRITLLDTPGHADFSAETERTLQVLDCAILVISASDGVQGHTVTLWRLLQKYAVPTFLFVNKMDQPDTDRERLMRELKAKLSDGCVCFGGGAGTAVETVNGAGENAGVESATGERNGAGENAGAERNAGAESATGERNDAGENTVAERKTAEGQEELARCEERTWHEECAWREECAMCSEQLLEEYLNTGRLTDASVAAAVAERRIFPCYFGSALHSDGVEELSDGLCRFLPPKEYPEEFGARVYKISRDASGKRLTHVKVTGGVLRVKQLLNNYGSAATEADRREEKADTLRIYAGAGFQSVEEVEAGRICAVTGPEKTFAGEGLGCEGRSEAPLLVPVLTYRLVPPEGTDMVKLFGQLRSLEEEEPELNIVRQERTKEIQVQVMGEVQTEVLQSLIKERYALDVTFSDGQLLYRETIASAAEGIGHFEPLRHYAEVHLLLEPGEPGSGMEYRSVCSEDVLDRNRQRLILSHLEECAHPGVLTGAPLTDMRITLLTGRAHNKHTEGGDFRQATFRALRQGLMQCKSVLLEPVFAFSLELPTAQLGRAMSDIQRMCGSFEPPVTEGERSCLSGSAPVATMRAYQREVNAYTRGQGRLSCMLKGYEPCHNAEEVITAGGYDPEEDVENPSSSIFCSHGAGTVVRWQEVPRYAHVESAWQPDGAALPAEGEAVRQEKKRRDGAGEASSGYITQEEIETIFRQTYKKTAQSYEPYRYHQQNTGGRTVEAAEGQTADDGQHKAVREAAEKPEEYFLVDGYNILFAWEELRELAESNPDGARDRLMDICCNFQGYHGMTLILVFDAYKVRGGQRSVQRYHNIYVVYTKEAETADQYIEKTVHRIGRKHRVTVATSDALEQMIVWGDGAIRMSAAGFQAAVEEASRRMREEYPESRRLSDKIRLGEL